MGDLALDSRSAGVAPPDGEWPDAASSTDDYAARFRGPVGEHFLDVQWRGVLEGLGVDRGTPVSVLDVGGGHAQLAGRLVSEGHSVTVLGSQLSCRSLLERRLTANEYQFVQGPLWPLSYEDQSFDTVVAVRMLAHMSDHRSFIREMCRVSARRVVLDFPVLRVFDRLGGFGFALKRGVEGNTRHFLAFEEDAITEIFGECGFRVVTSRRQFAIPMALHRAVGRASLTRLGESIARRTGLTHVLGSPVLMSAERIDEKGART